MCLLRHIKLWDLDELQSVSISEVRNRQQNGWWSPWPKEVAQCCLHPTLTFSALPVATFPPLSYLVFRCLSVLQIIFYLCVCLSSSLLPSLPVIFSLFPLSYSSCLSPVFFIQKVSFFPLPLTPTLVIIWNESKQHDLIFSLVLYRLIFLNVSLLNMFSPPPPLKYFFFLLEELLVWNVRITQHFKSTMHVCCLLNHFSCVQLFATPWTVATRLLCPWDFPGKNTGVECHFLLQGIFPTQGSNQVFCGSCIACRFFTPEPPGSPCKSSILQYRIFFLKVTFKNHNYWFTLGCSFPCILLFVFFFESAVPSLFGTNCRFWKDV